MLTYCFFGNASNSALSPLFDPTKINGLHNESYHTLCLYWPGRLLKKSVELSKKYFMSNNATFLEGILHLGVAR